MQGKVKAKSNAGNAGVGKAKSPARSAANPKLKKGARYIPPKNSTMIQTKAIKKKLESAIKNNIEQVMVHRAASSSGHLNLIRADPKFELPSKKEKKKAAAVNKTAAAAAKALPST